MKAVIPLTRTRKQARNIQSFYKQAGLYKQVQSMQHTNQHKQTMQKKDRLLKKRREKLQSVCKADTKSTSERHQQEVSSEAIKDDIVSQHVSTLQTCSCSKSALPLDKILNKLSVVQIFDGITVQGCYGHTTVIFKRPVIEGQYYLEFKILKPNLNCFKAKINSQSSARFGICPPTYPKNSPLGQDISLGFKSSNGGIVTKGKQDYGSQKLQENDVIGLGLSFSPPHKYQNKNELWEDSEVVLTKNGKIIAKSSKVYQQFYCPAISLYNYANLEIRLSTQSQEFKIEGYKAYENIFNEGVNYESLKESALFSHPMLDDI